MRNCLAIGNRARANETHGFVFGDDCGTTEPEQVVVGTHLFGEEIPELVQNALKENPQAFAWVIRRVIAFAENNRTRSRRPKGEL